MGGGGKGGGGGQATKERAAAAVAPAEGPLDFKGQGDAADRWGVKEFQEWWDNLTGSEREMLREYQGIGHELVNRYLRTGYIKVGYDKAAIDYMMKYLDSATSKGVLKRSTILYRGIDDLAGIMGATGKALVGKTFVEKGYMSTSLHRDIAVGEFGGGGGGALFRIKARAGTKGGYLGSLSKPQMGHEREFLVHRGARYRITGVRTADVPTKWGTRRTTVVDAELL
jgi:hypothetical protein